MASERASLLIERQIPVDGALWEPYSNAGFVGFDTSGMLLPTADVVAEERSQFYASGRQQNPDLRPRGLDEKALAEQETLAEAYKLTVHDWDGDPGLRQIYLWRVNENIANMRMVRAAAAGDDRRFEAYNAFIYGKPRQEVFAGVADELCTQAEAGLASGHAPVREAAARVIDLLGGHRGDRTLLVPPPEVFKRVRDDHLRAGGYYALLLAGVELPAGLTVVTPDVGDPALQQVLRNLESDYTLQDAPGATWSLKHAQQAVLRPVGYKLPPRRFLGLGAGHEIGTHLLERENGLRSAVQLLSSGFDRYELTNEGRAVMREQVAYDTFEEFAALPRWQDILRRHLATSLAEGLAGEPMDFAGVYEIMNAVDVLYETTKKPEDPADARRRADNRTWKLLAESIFKGTDGEHGAYRRYMVYLEGGIDCWRAAAEDPDVISQGDRGKFGITNQRHRPVLQKYGILPQAGQEAV
ncbi:MAG TPA: hypothetical protein VLF40_04280 [Candidatus Saccharimonadales bacterium]|nr:hypothetical protein [Candidatus Saccharimonadales bacterium]